LTNPHAGQPILTAGAPIGDGRGVVIMVHGRNAGPQDILSLVPALDRSGLTYLAPAAANRTWYPYSFLTETASNEPDLSSALSVMQTLVDDTVARGIRRDRIVLLGFSQGACLVAETAVRRAAHYGGVLIFSGGLIGPPGTTWNASGSFAGTPVFLGCSDRDAHIPKWRVEESSEVFGRMGADVTRRLYPGTEHLVTEDEIAFAQRVLDRVGT
jgi:predicted esterase